MTERQIPLFKPFIPPREELMPALEEVLYSGYIAQGEKVKEFEKKFGEYIGNPNVVAVSSCTAALHLALILAGVGPGDEVISTPMTAEPTNMAILHTGAKIVWADINPETGNISPLSVRSLITPKTKAIMVVHYGGVCADMYNLERCAFWNNITIIEDCAHALGAKVANRMEGDSALKFSCFSFQAIKHLTTVEGGALVVGDPSMLHKARRIRWFGIDREDVRTQVDISEIGYKYNPNEVMATMGLIQLKYLDGIVSKHQENGEWFAKNLHTLPHLRIVKANPFARPPYWFYTIFSDRRDRIKNHLRLNGIGCGRVHRPNIHHSIFDTGPLIRPHNNLFFDGIGCEGSGLYTFWISMLHIPCGWWVTPDDREYIAEKIEEALTL